MTSNYRDFAASYLLSELKNQKIQQHGSNGDSDQDLIYVHGQ
eukprot:CAMPEP_0198148840 /NCGR_PEP_ID=MMETSP1443-20131203/43630_1 /TAXON_ID=186043 /ORGANISM="Entomoneis sp., Strain CCMP2396" /LENGTH=41 /DNA_ID= /DNA_START= /DNA_END= /DNA_ORIENTATION=